MVGLRSVRCEWRERCREQFLDKERDAFCPTAHDLHGVIADRRPAEADANHLTDIGVRQPPQVDAQCQAGGGQSGDEGSDR